MKKILMIIFILLLCAIWFAVGFRTGKITELTGSFPSIKSFFTNEEDVEYEEEEEEQEQEEVIQNETVAEVIVEEDSVRKEPEKKNQAIKQETRTKQNYNQKYYLLSESTSSKSIINIDSTCTINLENSIALEGSYSITKDDKIVIEIRNAYKEDEGKVLNGVSGLLMFDRQSDSTIKLIGMDIQKGDVLTDEIIASSGISVGNVFTLE